VVVFGSGASGLNVIQAPDVVPHMIIGVDLNPARETLARQFGMSTSSIPRTSRAISWRTWWNSPVGRGLQFECVGNTTLMRQALECCHPGLGRIHHYRSRSVGQEIADSSLPTGDRASLARYGIRRRTRPDPGAADRRLVYGQENQHRRFITHVLPLERINEAST